MAFIHFIKTSEKTFIALIQEKQTIFISVRGTLAPEKNAQPSYRLKKYVYFPSAGARKKY